MSWSRYGGCLTVHPQLRTLQAVFTTTTRYQACALNPASSHSALCTLRHHRSSQFADATSRRSYLESGRRSLIHSRLATESPVRDARRGAYGYSLERHFSTRTGGITIKGPTILDCFAGTGSVSLAALEVGYTTVYANDKNRHCAATYEINHCRGGPGISKVDTRAIEEVTSTMSGLACKKYGYLLYEVIKLAIHLRNPIVFLENVKSLAERNHKEAMDLVREEFELLGYHVSYHIYNAVDFNLPQNRERVFIVAVRKDLATRGFVFKEPPSRRENLALRDILDPPDSFVDRGQYELQHGVLVPKTMNGRRTEFELDAGLSKTLKRVGYVNRKGIKRWISRDIIYHHSGFAGCITTTPSYWYQVPGPAGKEDIIRRLSVREGCRLQGLPEGFVLPKSENQAWHQLGNMVPPPMVKWIFQCMREQYPDILSPDTYSTMEVWPQVQAPKRSPQEESKIEQQLHMLEVRRMYREGQREAPRALEEEAERAAGAGKSPATKTKRNTGKHVGTRTNKSSKTDEDEISAALESKLHIK